MKIKSFNQFQYKLMEGISSSTSLLFDKVDLKTILEKYTKYKLLVKFKQKLTSAIDKGWIEKEDIQELIDIVETRHPEIPTMDKFFCMFVIGCGCDLKQLLPDLTQEELDGYLEWSQYIYEDSMGTGIVIPTFEKFMGVCEELCKEVGIPVSKI